MAEIVIIKPGAVKPSQRKILADVGIVVIEAENPADVRFIRAEGPEISGNDFCYAALYALEKAGSSTANAAFVSAVRQLVARNRGEQPK